MFLSEYPTEDLVNVWRAFAKIKQAYTPHERWKEIVEGTYRNASFLELTLDDIIYSFMKNTYKDEDFETMAPFYTISFMIILAKKSIIDYNVEDVIPSYEFETFFKTTRLHSMFERARDLSESKEDFEKIETKFLEVYPEEETTLYDIFNSDEKVKLLNDIIVNTDTNKNDDDVKNDLFSIKFIDILTNIIVYDFIRNYFHLKNERNVVDVYTVDSDDYTIGCNDRSVEKGAVICGQEDEPCDSGS